MRIATGGALGLVAGVSLPFAAAVGAGTGLDVSITATPTTVDGNGLTNLEYCVRNNRDPDQRVTRTLRYFAPDSNGNATQLVFAETVRLDVPGGDEVCATREVQFTCNSHLGRNKFQLVARDKAGDYALTHQIVNHTQTAGCS